VQANNVCFLDKKKEQEEEPGEEPQEEPEDLKNPDNWDGKEINDNEVPF
jgi:hypothetical protein